MTKNYAYCNKFIGELLELFSLDKLIERLSPKENISSPRIQGGTSMDIEAIEKRYALLNVNDEQRQELADEKTIAHRLKYQNNIENFIGTVKVPVGVVGPLKVNGIFAQGDYYIPLATTEAALVASYHRGCALINEAGGCSSFLVSEGLTRAPGFAFDTLASAGTFVRWCMGQMEHFKKVAEATTAYGKLNDMQVSMEGNHVYLLFDYTTGEASGQNMVTFATDAILQYILTHSPIKPLHSFIEANLSGDKKASSQSFQGVRGKKVTTEVTLTEKMIKKYLHTTPQAMDKYWRLSAMGGVLGGTIGTQGHFANGIAALYLACGQDVACVAESAVGVTRLELVEGGLYAAVTLPNLMVGTVGGGTKLPSQSACLDIVGLKGTNSAKAFAEIAGGLVLAGELSIIGALCAGHFARAHKTLARG